MARVAFETMANKAEAVGGMRLNRFLARAGIASRRGSDELIRQGVVKVNGQVVAEPGCSVVAGRDQVEVEGAAVRLPEGNQYVLYNKTCGLLVTRRDTHGRPTVFDAVQGLRAATVTVGRLDRDTSGLLLLTDDGELAFRLMHPRFGIDKCYRALVEGRPGASALATLRRGVQLEDGVTAPAKIRPLGSRRFELVIHEGRKRQVRRMFAAVGHRVLSLERVGFANLDLLGLAPGKWRSLTEDELARLRQLVGLEGD